MPDSVGSKARSWCQHFSVQSTKLKLPFRSGSSPYSGSGPLLDCIGTERYAQLRSSRVSRDQRRDS